MITTANKQDRIQKKTPIQFNLQIVRRTEDSVYQLAPQKQEQMTARINALYEEWDIERYLEAGASIFIFSSLLLSFLLSYYWLILTFGTLIFLFQQAIQGWCMPVTLLRWLNIRTQKEINEEIYALKVLREDFKSINKNSDPIKKANEALLAVRR